MKNNKAIYSTVEFDSWAFREGLIDTERFLIEQYLDKEGKTLEAGTGGGRILLEMKKMGFKSLCGFDFVEEFIEIAKKKDTSGNIMFEVQDATSLSYLDSSFDQVIYLQQIISLIPNEDKRLKAIKEAYRVLKPGGRALFSFLSFEARSRDFQYLLFLLYLKALRLIFKRRISIQYLPWLKLGGRLNLKAFLDAEPYVFWYKLQELRMFLQGAGFKILAVGSTHQIKKGTMLSWDKLKEKDVKGMLYVVCSK